MFLPVMNFFSRFFFVFAILFLPVHAFIAGEGEGDQPCRRLVKEASQGARRVFWPVLAGVARLALILAGGAVIVFTAEPTPQLVFGLIGAGMLLYGLTVAGAIRLGAWR